MSDTAVVNDKQKSKDTKEPAGSDLSRHVLDPKHVPLRPSITDSDTKKPTAGENTNAKDAQSEVRSSTVPTAKVGTDGSLHFGPTPQPPERPPVVPTGTDKQDKEPKNQPGDAAVTAPKPQNAEVERQKLITAAIDLHDAVNQSTMLVFSSPDVPKIMNIIEPMSADQRKQVQQEYAIKYPGRDLLADLKSKLSGPDAARAEAIFKRQDGVADNSGQIHEALAKIKDLDAPMDDVPEVARVRAEKEIRDSINTLSKEQLTEVEAKYKKDYGSDLQTDLQNNPFITDATKSALKTYMNGADHRSDQDTLKMANDALTNGRPDIFNEVFRDASPLARQIFAEQDGFKKIDQAFDGADAKIAKDYAERGEASLSTIVAGDTHWYHTNRDDITRAVKSVSEQDRSDYLRGEELARSQSTAVTPADKRAAAMYNSVNDALKNGGSEREAAIWKAQLKNQESVTQGLLEARSDGGLFGIGAGVNKDKAFSAVENISEKDFKYLRTHPDAVRQIADTALKYDGEYGDRIAKALYDKLDVKDYAVSKNLGQRPMAERLTDNSDNTANRVDALTSMNVYERRAYATNANGYKTYVDSVLKSDDERTLAMRMAQKTGPADATDQVIVDKLKASAPLKIFNDVEAAIASDPTLKGRLQNPVTEQDKTLSNAFHAATRAAVDKAGLGDQSYGDTFIPGQYDTFDKAAFMDGRIPLDLKLQLTSDRKEQIDTIMKAPDDEKARLLNAKPDAATKAFQDSVLGSNEAERQVILNGLQQKDANGHTGYLAPADQMRLLAVDGSNAEDMKQMLSSMTPDQRQDLANDYFTKYHSLVSSDTIAKVAPDEQWRFRELLAPTDLNVRQVALDAQESNDSHASDWDNFLKNNWDYSRVAADNAQDNLTKFAAQHAEELSKLTPEQRKQFDDAVENYTKAEKAYVESKGQFAETFVDATLTVAAVGGALFSGGTSLALLGAVGGAAYRIGMMSSIEGTDFDSSAGNILKQGFEGGTQGALGFLGPEQLGLTMSLKVGSELAAASAAKIVSGSAEALFKSGSENILKDGLAELTRQGAISGDQAIAALAEKVAADGVDKDVVRQVIANQIKSDTMRGVKNILLNEGEAYAKSMAAAQIGAQGKEILATAAGFESPDTLLQRMKSTAVSTAGGVTLFHGVFKLGAVNDYAKVALGLDQQGHVVAGEGTVIRHADGTLEPVVGKDKLVKLNTGDAIYEKGAYKELADGTKTFTIDNNIARYDASGKIIQAGDMVSQHSVDFSYVTDPNTGKTVVDKVTAYKPDGSADELRSLTLEDGIYYRTSGGYKVPVGSEVSVDAKGAVTIKGEGPDGNKLQTEIGKGRWDVGDKDKAVDSITYNVDGTRTFHSVDNYTVSRDGLNRITETINGDGVRKAFEYQGQSNQVNKVEIGDNRWTLQNGKWLDKDGKVFADNIQVYSNGVIDITNPADTLRTASKPNEPIKEVTVYSNSTQYTYKSTAAATTDAVPPPEKLSSSDYFKEQIKSGEVVKQTDGTYYRHDAITGAQSYFDESGKLVAQRTADGERHFEYDQKGVLDKVIYAKDGYIESTIKRHDTPNGEIFQETDAAGKVVDHYTKVTVGDDGSITKLGSQNDTSLWSGVRERPDGTKIKVSEVGKETVEAGDLDRERLRVEQLAHDGFNDPARQQRFEQWSKDFEQAAAKRQPPLSNEEIANTYFQLEKLMTKGNAVLPHDERMELAEQFMYKAANPNTIGQGSYNTCNVTAEIEHRFTTLHPSDALRMVTDVATTGRFITDTGSIIDMTAMNNVMRPLPGVIENQFDSTNYSGRDMFDQLFQSTAVEIHWQTQSPGQARATSTVWDLRAGQQFRPGDLRYEFTSTGDRQSSGEVINDHSTNPPTRLLSNNSGTKMVDPLSGKLQTVYEQEPAESPDLSGSQLLSVGKAILGHSEPPHMLARSSANESAAQKVYSVEEMIDKLKDMQANGGQPTTVFVDTRDPMFHGGTNDAQSGGPHVINVQKIELRDGKYYVDYTNQWTTADDRLGEHAVPAEDLFRAMQYREATVATKLANDQSSQRLAAVKGIATGLGIGTGIGTGILGTGYGAYELYKHVTGDANK